MIEKIIHQIWIGDNELPNEFKLYQDKLKSIYNDFEFIYWDNNLVNKYINEYPFKEYIFGKYPYAFKSDLLRFWILYNFGGLYFDTDIDPLKKIPEKYLTDFSFITCKYNTYNFECATGFLASEKYNNTTKIILDDILENSKLYDINNSDLNLVSGPTAFTKILLNKNLLSEKLLIFDYYRFYPYGWWEMDRKYENFLVTSPNSFGVHHWTYSWK